MQPLDLQARRTRGMIDLPEQLRLVAPHAHGDGETHGLRAFRSVAIGSIRSGVCGNVWRRSPPAAPRPAPRSPARVPPHPGSPWADWAVDSPRTEVKPRTLAVIPRAASALAGGVFVPSSPTSCTPISSWRRRGSSSDRWSKRA